MKKIITSAGRILYTKTHWTTKLAIAAFIYAAVSAQDSVETQAWGVVILAVWIAYLLMYRTEARAPETKPVNRNELKDTEAAAWKKYQDASWRLRKHGGIYLTESGMDAETYKLNKHAKKCEAEWRKAEAASK